MVTHSKLSRTPSSEEQEIVPSPARIRAMAAEIRKGWSPAERRRRALLVRFAALRELIASDR